MLNGMSGELFEEEDELFEAALRKAVHEYYLDIAAELPTAEECKLLYPIPPKFDKKMRRLCAREWRNYTRKKAREERLEHGNEHKAPFRVRRAVITAIAAILAASVTAFAAVPELRGAVMQWFSTHSTYSLSNPHIAVPDKNWVLGYVPAGYTLTDSDDTDGSIWHLYTDGKDGNVDFSAIKLNASMNMVMDNEHSTYSKININGVTADFYAANEEGYDTFLIWERDDYFLCISGNIDKNAVIKMAESVHLVEQ